MEVKSTHSSKLFRRKRRALCKSALANAQFELNGELIKLSSNQRKALASWWRVVLINVVGTFRSAVGILCVFHYSPEHGDQGFPGNVDVSVTYTLNR